MGKIGVLGGTFDPIHNGHLKIAQECYQKFGLTQVLFIPCNIPPLKGLPTTTAFHRLHMVDIAIQNISYFNSSSIEIERPGKSYTFDTLQLLQKLYPQSSLTLIMGADAMEQFPEWHSPLNILNIADILVFSRPGYDFSKVTTMLNREPFVKYKNKVQCVTSDSIDISATELRRQLLAEKDVSRFIPVQVLDYIKQNKLYR